MSASASQICVHCLGLKWVCESHPKQPWPHEGCEGAGKPCPVCNAEPWPDKPPHWQSLLK